MSTCLKRIRHEAELCVVGGGLAGTFAAVAAARHGVRVVLMQDRPMLGGNSSSEIRMWVRGARGRYNRESGLLCEAEEESIRRNSGCHASLWDGVLYGMVKAEKNITLLLNTSCLDACCEGGEVRSVLGWQLTTYTYHEVHARYFADCSGDSILAPLTGAAYRLGREGNAEFCETIGPREADGCTMGMSLLLQARETDGPVEFIPPAWANVYPTDADFGEIDPEKRQGHAEVRNHRIGTDGCNLWWMELGGLGPAVENTEGVRDELLKVAYGVWDHIKNRGDHGCENWDLEWVGILPGKRESLRYVGAYTMTQNDIAGARVFEDVVAYGGWPMDDHNPKGIAGGGEEPSVMHPAPSPYGIALRCLYSANVGNLFFAGRNISVTHAALSSTRVMATCSLLGQALGTAVAVCKHRGALPAGLSSADVDCVQQLLLQDGVFLPGVRRRMAAPMADARLNLPDAEVAVLQNGIDRPRDEQSLNRIELAEGQSICITLPEPRYAEALILRLDPDYSRESIADNVKTRTFAMTINRGKDLARVRTAATLPECITAEADGERLYATQSNYRSLVRIPIGRQVREVCVHPGPARNGLPLRVYACDLV